MINLVGQQDQYIPPSGSLTGEVVDATNAVWTLKTARNYSPGLLHCSDGPVELERIGHPISLRGSNDLTFKGGRVKGSVRQTSIRYLDYCNSAAFTLRDCSRATIDGFVADGCWDGIRFTRSPSGIIKNVRLSNLADDAIELDSLDSCIIRDSVIDGCFVGISTAGDDDDYDENAVIDIDNLWLRLKPFVFAKNATQNLKMTHGHAFKTGARNPKFKIKNSVFAYAVDPFDTDSRLIKMFDNLIESVNNRILWLSSAYGLPPAVLTDLPDGFTLVTGDEAIFEWEKVYATQRTM